MNLAIESFNLTRVFDGYRAVDRINLKVERGSFYGFLGRNGAGKSTTIKMLTGLLDATEGEARILSKNPFSPKEDIEIKRNIGVVPEDLALFDYVTAREQMTFIGRLFEMPQKDLQLKIDRVLEMMDLKDEKKLVIDYSHGMKKKLAFATALLPDPEILFLDEPFEGVDVVSCLVIQRFLKDFVEKGSTVFLTSHILDIVEKLCSDVGIISRGELVFQGSVKNLPGDKSLSNYFIEVVGAETEVLKKMDWLE